MRGLIFDYGLKRALYDVNFALEKGTVTALVGPNGAGKTTLLRCLAALEQPFAGRILLGDLDILEEPRLAHAKVGFLQDFFGVYDELSVRRNLLFAAASQGLHGPAIESAVARAASSVGLTDRMNEPAGALSRGLKQRLAIARSIIHAPPLLLLDEPAAGLDPEARKDLSDLIRNLHQSGMTIVVSSHILAELDEYSTHMLAMRDGKASGPTALSETTSGQRLAITMSGPVENLVALLQSQPHVQAIRRDTDTVSFDWLGSQSEQNELLRILIENGININSFGKAAVDLERLYLGGVTR